MTLTEVLNTIHDYRYDVQDKILVCMNCGREVTIEQLEHDPVLCGGMLKEDRAKVIREGPWNPEEKNELKYWFGTDLTFD